MNTLYSSIGKTYKVKQEVKHVTAFVTNLVDMLPLVKSFICEISFVSIVTSRQKPLRDSGSVSVWQ